MSRASVRREAGGLSWWIDPAEEAAVAPYLRPIEELARLPVATVLKDLRVKALVRIPAPEGTILVKVFRCRTFWTRIRYAFRRSKARREVALAAALLERGVPTLAPLAAGERRRGPLLVESYLVLRARPEALSLDRALLGGGAPDAKAPIPPGRERRRVVEAYGRLIRAAQDAGVYQDDVGLNNCVIDLAETRARGEPALYVIDLERAWLPPSGRLSKSRRAWNLGTLFWATPRATRRDRIAFLRGYAGATRDAVRAGADDCARAAAHREGHNRRRMRRNAVTPNRFIEPFDDGTLEGFFRKRFEEGEPGPSIRWDDLREVADFIRGLARGGRRAAGPAGSVRIARPEGATPFEATVRWFRASYLGRPARRAWIEANCDHKVRRRGAPLPIAYFRIRTSRFGRAEALVTAAPPSPSPPGRGSG